MSALHPPTYRPGDRVATAGRRTDQPRQWALGTVADAGAHAALVTVRWDDNVIGLFGRLDANLRHLDQVPITERHWLDEGQRRRLLRAEAARRLHTALQLWPHTSPSQRAALVALVDDLVDDSFTCLGCDSTALALLGVDLVDPHRQLTDDGEVAA